MKPIQFPRLFQSDYFRVIAGLVAVFTLILLYALEIHWFNNTIRVASLLLAGGLFGLLAGAFVGWRFREKGEDLLERFIYFLLGLFLGVVLFPLIFSLANRLLSPYPVVKEEVEFVEANAYFGSRFGRIKDQPSREDGYHLFFIRQNRLERVKSHTNPYPEAEKGDTIKIPVKRGLLGFDLVCLK